MGETVNILTFYLVISGGKSVLSNQTANCDLRSEKKKKRENLVISNEDSVSFAFASARLKNAKHAKKEKKKNNACSKGFHLRLKFSIKPRISAQNLSTFQLFVNL